MRHRSGEQARASSRRPRRAAVVAAGLLTMALAAACSSGTPPRAPSASPAVTLRGPAVAQQWFAARAEALRQGVANVGPFYAPEVVLDHSALGPGPAHGREAALQLLHSQWHPRAWTRTAAEPVYLSTAGAVTVERVRDRTVLGNALLPGSVATLHTITPEGSTSETLALGIADVWALSRSQVRRTHRMDVAAAAATEYASAWSASDADAITDLYAPTARVLDSVQGLDVTDRDRIVALAGGAQASSGLAGVSLRTLPGGDGSAVYTAGPWQDSASIDHLVLLATVPPGQSIAVELRLDGRGRIVEERRYHRADAILRSSLRPAGWWDDVDIPAPVAHELTGVVQFGRSRVEVFNGTPGLTAIIPWAADRFTEAGLAPPDIVSISFHDPSVDLCSGVTGQIQGGEVTLCYHVRTACADPDCTTWRPSAKDTLLHELGHAWIDQNVDIKTRTRVQQYADLPTWASARYRWEDRACEFAAVTLAWGLIDEPFPLNPRLGNPRLGRSCADLAEVFEILTGSPPQGVTGCAEESE